MELPLGVPDPLYLCELALEMKKSIRELTTGEGGMSAHELCVIWPAYFEVRREMQEAERKKREAQKGASR
jgi:hypothetical protein